MWVGLLFRCVCLYVLACVCVCVCVRVHACRRVCDLQATVSAPGSNKMGCHVIIIRHDHCFVLFQ